MKPALVLLVPPTLLAGMMMALSVDSDRSSIVTTGNESRNIAAVATQVEAMTGPAPERSAVRAPEQPAVVAEAASSALQPVSDPQSAMDRPSSGDRVWTARALAHRLGTTQEQFVGAALALGKFVDDHAIDTDLLTKDQLVNLARRHAELWSRRTEELRDIAGAPEAMADPAAIESNQRRIEAIEASYAVLEDGLAHDFRRSSSAAPARSQ